MRNTFWSCIPSPSPRVRRSQIQVHECDLLLCWPGNGFWFTCSHFQLHALLSLDRTRPYGRYFLEDSVIRVYCAAPTFRWLSPMSRLHRANITRKAKLFVLIHVPPCTCDLMLCHLVAQCLLMVLDAEDSGLHGQSLISEAVSTRLDHGQRSGDVTEQASLLQLTEPKSAQPLAGDSEAWSC